MGLLDRNILEGRQTTTATRTSTRNPTRRRLTTPTFRTSERTPGRTVSPINPQAADFALRHPDAGFQFTPNPLGAGSGAGGFSGGIGSPGGSPGVPGTSPGAPQGQPGNVPSFVGDLDALRNERLAAALAAIGADFDLQEGGLNKQLAALKNLFDRGMMTNLREEGFAEESINEGFAERGLFRSGLRGKGLARGLAPFQERRADLIGQLNPEVGAEGTQVRDIMSMIKLLVPQEASARASAEMDSRADRLDIEQLMALLGAGLGGLR